MARDLACALALLAVAAAYYLLARDIGRTALSDVIGPAGLPLIYAYVLAVLAISLGLVAVLKRRSAEPEAGSGDVRPARRILRAAGAFLIGVAYLVAVPSIGYPFATALAIAGMAAYQGETPSLRLALVACAGAAALYVVFDLVLGVDMPVPWNLA